MFSELWDFKILIHANCLAGTLAPSVKDLLFKMFTTGWENESLFLEFPCLPYHTHKSVCNKHMRTLFCVAASHILTWKLLGKDTILFQILN